MNPVTVKVEIRFDGTTWVDVSADVVLSAGLSISRGRDSETGDAISVGTCSLTLQNDAGEYSPDLPASSHYPNVVEGVSLRVFAYADGAWRPRFYGTVQSWDTGPLDETGAQATCLVTAADSLGSLPSYTFRQAASEVVRNSGGVLYHWPQRELSGNSTPLIGALDLVDNGGTESLPGGLLPMDEGDEPHPIFKASSGERVQVLTLPTGLDGWVLRWVILGQPTAAGNLMAIKTSAETTPPILSWNPATGFTLSTPIPLVVAPPASFPVVLEVWQDGLSNAQLAWCDASGTSDTDSLGVANLAVLRALTINPTRTGGASWPAGHLTVSSFTAGTTPALLARLVAYATAILSPRISTATPAPDQVLGFASAPVTIAGTALGETTLPLLGDRDAADAMGALVTGMGARLVDNLDGTLRWVSFDDDTAAIAIPSGIIDPSMRWRTDSAGWVSSETVTWPDGTSYTAERADGKRQSGSIEGVHATRLQDRSYADWLVNTASRGAQLPVAPFNVASLTEAQKVTLCSVDPADRVSFTGLPAHMPSALTCICEGVDETLTDASWDITLKLSPDVYSRLGIYDTSTWDSGVLWAP